MGWDRMASNHPNSVRTMFPSRNCRAILYAAYGSNMDVGQMKKRCPRARPAGAGTIRGWRLVMRGVADIEPSSDGVTPVGLWWVTRDCVTRLDLYEGFPTLYVRQYLVVADDLGRRHDAFAYVMTERHWGSYYPASRAYVRTVLRGYRDFGHDDPAAILAAQDDARRT